MRARAFEELSGEDAAEVEIGRRAKVTLDLTEGALRDVATEIHRLASTSEKSSPRPRAATQRRIAGAARRGTPVQDIAAEPSHLYLWVPNALLPQGLQVMDAWGFKYVSNIVWEKVRKDGEPDGRGVGFYFRNVTELLLFGVRGKNARTLDPGRSQVNIMRTRKREHSRKPDEQYRIIEECSWGPRLEMFSRGTRRGWTVWGNQADESYKPTWDTYRYNSAMGIAAE